MAVNLGRSRGDNTGSQNATLNSVKAQKVAFPKFSGKNASELNALAQFIEDKFNANHEFSRDITSKNVDTTLERLHTAMLKLKEASDSDNETAYDEIKATIVDEVKSLITSTNSSSTKSKDSSEAKWTEEDKEYLKELIVASTLTEAKEKTTDQSGQNGLTKDDINTALNATIKTQQVLNKDVVAAAEESNKIVETADTSSSVKDELKQMFNENKPDTSDADNFAKQNIASFEKLQDLVSSQLSRLNTHINIMGDNFKNSPLFNFKNPFSGSVGKIPSVAESISGTFENLNNKIQAGIEKAKLPFEKVSELFDKSQDYMANKIADVNAVFSKVGDAVSGFKDSVAKKIDTVKTGMKNVAMAPVKLVSNGLAKMKDVVTSPFKKLNPFKKKDKSENGKKKQKKSPFSSLLGKLFKPKLVNLAPKSFGIIFKGIRQQLTALQKRLLKKGKLKGMKLPAVPAAPMISPKEKKEKKQRSKLFDNVGKFMKKISDIFKNIVTHILAIINQIVIGLCKAIAKGIGIILKAIFLTPWGLIILASILLISIGILLISMAVKKLVNYVVDDLGPIIKEKLQAINPQTLNNFVDKVSDFINTFTNILNGVFAPIILIGTAIKAIVEPMKEVVSEIAKAAASVLIPVIQGIAEILKLVVKPILFVLKNVIVGISQILVALVPVINIIVDTIVGLITNLIKPIFDLINAILIPVINGIKDLITIIAPIITEVVDVIIKGAVLLIQGIITGIKSAIDFVVQFVKNPGAMIKKIVDSVKNWLAGFADVEIGVWKFKFKPFGFLKGLKTEPEKDDGLAVDDEKTQEIIDSLQDRLKELQGYYNKSQEQIKYLQEKLIAAVSVKIDKKAIINLQKSSRLAVLNIRHSVVPRLKTIISNLKKIFDYIKNKFDIVENLLGSDSSSQKTINAVEKTKIPEKITQNSSKLDATQTSKGVDNKPKSNFYNKIFGFKFNGILPKGGPELVKKEPKLDIAPASINQQFKPLTNINNKGAKDSQNLANSIEEISTDTTKKTNGDITNSDVITFLKKMFENVDTSFQNINKKLDNPQVIPMPTPMNINNQALIGAN